MVIIRETEQIHNVLGPIYFDNGKMPIKTRSEDYEPYWVARPMGWSADGVEILLAGDSSGPTSDSLERAVHVFKFLEKIEKEGRDLIRPRIVNALSTDFPVKHHEADLRWIDCQQTKTTVGFHWEGYAYVSWDASLNDTNDVVDLQEIIS